MASEQSTLSIPEEAFKDILTELERQPLQENKYRTTAGSGRSQAFLTVNRRCLAPDYSRQCWLRPKLLFHLKEFADKYVDIPYNSITVNQNYAAAPHRDKNNRGDSFLVAFGDFTGGTLKIHEGPLEGIHDIRHKPIKADFSKMLHSAQEFQGKRFSLVFYTFYTSRLPQLPPWSVKKEGEKYYFYRGTEKITTKNGLAHPLRGRKKTAETLLVKTPGEVSVSFD